MALRIITMQDGPAYSPDKGTPVRTRIVWYEVDGQGPFGLHGPADELTIEEIRKRIRAEAVQIRELLGGGI